MKMANWNGEEFARQIGVKGRSTRRWANGETAINYASWCVLCAEAGLGQIWKFSPL
jgi:hypothetical protein